MLGGLTEGVIKMPSLDRSYPALIFKANRGPLHHGALGIARSLGKLGVPVYAIVEDNFTPVGISRYLTKAFVWKDWPSDREALLDAISAVGKAIDRPTILIPIDDLSAVVSAENAIALGRWFVIPQVLPSIPRRLANKASFYSLCAQLGIPCPRSTFPRSLEDVHEFVEHTTFPIVVKAAEQWRPLNSALNVKVVSTKGALLELYDELDQQHSQIILQEFIPGEHWIYHGYRNAKANVCLSFTGKKLLDYPLGAGSTAVGVSVRNDPLRTLSEKILQAISYSGITDMDWRYDERDGQYKIVDCNPRVGMNFRMFESSAAVDVVRAQHLDLTGQNVALSQMVDNRLFIVESIYALSRIRGSRPAWTNDAVKKYSRSKELAWWSGDDVLPVVSVIIRLVPQTVQRALRQFWIYTRMVLRKGWRRNDVGKQPALP